MAVRMILSLLKLVPNSVKYSVTKHGPWKIFTPGNISNSLNFWRMEWLKGNSLEYWTVLTRPLGYTKKKRERESSVYTSQLGMSWDTGCREVVTGMSAKPEWLLWSCHCAQHTEQLSRQSHSVIGWNGLRISEWLFHSNFCPALFCKSFHFNVRQISITEIKDMRYTLRNLKWLRMPFPFFLAEKICDLLLNWTTIVFLLNTQDKVYLRMGSFPQQS